MFVFLLLLRLLLFLPWSEKKEKKKGKQEIKVLSAYHQTFRELHTSCLYLEQCQWSRHARHKGYYYVDSKLRSFCSVGRTIGGGKKDRTVQKGRGSSPSCPESANPLFFSPVRTRAFRQRHGWLPLWTLLAWNGENGWSL